MGNSGSAHQIAAVPNSNETNNYHHSPSQWSQSIPRDSTNRHSHQIKVLPELKGATRLRATDNGNILHGGGTLSGRRDLVLHNGVFRTRSTSSTLSPNVSESEHIPYPSRFMQRSQTQLNITREKPGRNPLSENAQIKRFGSEPDLRDSGDERNDTQKLDSGPDSDRNNFPKAKLIRNKKKKAAPLPPIQSKVNQASVDKSKLNYDPSRFGWKKQDENLSVINPEHLDEKEAPRKLRLFKTKAETRKGNEVVLREHEKRGSTDRHHSNRYSIQETERQPFNSLPYYHDVRHQEFDQLSDHNDQRESSNRVVPPLPQRFRREKSFDLSLLMQQKDAKPSIKTSAMKQINSKIPKNNDDSQRTGPIGSNVESKLKSRKFSQPATSAINSGFNAETDFKKELLAATRRRSRNIDLKTNNDATVVIEPKSHNQNGDEFQNSLRNNLSERLDKKDIGIDFTEEDRRNSRNQQIDENDMGRPQHQLLSESATKTFYFGMSQEQKNQLNDEVPMMNKFDHDLLAEPNQFSNSDSESTDSSLSSALIDHFPLHMINTLNEHLNDPDSNPNGIQVNMRPTLPRRQFEVPRFSPAAAWKNLAQTDFDVATSPTEAINLREQRNYSSYGVNDIDDSLNQQQLLESRIERIYRDPAPGFPDNKSGDSGISGDAGLQERVESPTVREVSNNDKIGPFLLPWTPLQDLGEESSSDDGGEADSKEELTKLVNRGHVFSLSLPRESHLLGFGGDSLQLADVKTFNSLQKLKRTVSSAFGGSNDSRDNNKIPIYRNENWMLSRSAPNSIDNNLFPPILNAQSDCDDENDELNAYDEEENENSMGSQKFLNNEHRSHNRRPRQQTQSEHSKILPPSFNYLTGGKHLMYLPSNQDHASGYDVRDHISDGIGDERRYAVEADKIRSSKYNADFSEQKERESLQDPPEFALNNNQQTSSTEQPQYAFQVRNNCSSKSRNHHRFTFQSTVRQIERRRLAERLSKDAEQKEAQRLSELEAMRRVEEEFQKKRAREKASIRHQLRLYSLGEDGGGEVNYASGQYTSLPIEWKSNGPRDEPDGAVSSPAQSPTSQKFLSTRKCVEADTYVDTKTPYISRLIEQKSGYRNSNSAKNIEVRTKPTEVLSEFHTTRREYIEYRNSRKLPVNNSGLSGAQSLNHQQMSYKQSIDDQPSDNYRKSFAHGRSICSSDSDMSGPIRGMGRRKHRSRSPSPEL